MELEGEKYLDSIPRIYLQSFTRYLNENGNNTNKSRNLFCKLNRFKKNSVLISIFEMSTKKDNLRGQTLITNLWYHDYKYQEIFTTDRKIISMLKDYKNKIHVILIGWYT